MTARDVIGRLGPFARERGAGPVARSCVDWGVRWTLGLFPATRPGGGFVLDGVRRDYVHELFNHTWLTERAVELSLVGELDFSGRVLEVGNVLAHYPRLPQPTVVVDRYEKAPGVRNLDVCDLGPEQYDLIVSISTLEHVGLDEPVTEPEKPVRALARMRAALVPGGRLWITVPIGYNLPLDAHLRNDDHGFTLRALRRSPGRNDWRQVAVSEVWDVPYDRLLYTAHALVVADLRV